MATTGIINATNIVILAGMARIASLTSAELSVSRDMIDSTTKDSAGWNEILPGKASWEMSGEGKLRFDRTYNAAYLENASKDKTKIKVCFGVEGTGDDMYYGDAYVTSFSESTGVEDAASYSFTLTGTSNISTLNVVSAYTYSRAAQSNEFSLPVGNVYTAMKIEWSDCTSDMNTTLDFEEKASSGDAYTSNDESVVEDTDGFLLDYVVFTLRFNKVTITENSGTIGNLKVVVYN